MTSFSLEQILGIAVIGLLLVCAFQFLILLVIAKFIKTADRERSTINKETFGLVKRIEGLTSQRREQMLQHYDRMLEELGNRLPIQVATQTSTKIIELEQKIFQHISDIESEPDNPERNKKRIDSIVRSMQNLEQSIIDITSASVRIAITDGRKEIGDEQQFYGGRNSSTAL